MKDLARLPSNKLIQDCIEKGLPVEPQCLANLKLTLTALRAYYKAHAKLVKSLGGVPRDLPQALTLLATRRAKGTQEQYSLLKEAVGSKPKPKSQGQGVRSQGVRRRVKK